MSMKKKPQDATLSIEEAANLLGVSERTILRAIGSRRLVAAKVLRRWLVDSDSLQRWLETRLAPFEKPASESELRDLLRQLGRVSPETPVGHDIFGEPEIYGPRNIR